MEAHYTYELSEAASRALIRRLKEGSIRLNDTFYEQVNYNLSALLPQEPTVAADARTKDELLDYYHNLVLFGVSISGLFVITFMLFSIFYKNDRMERYCKCQAGDLEQELSGDLNRKVFSQWVATQNSQDPDRHLQPGWGDPDDPESSHHRKQSLWGILSSLGAIKKTNGAHSLSVAGQEPDVVPYRGSLTDLPSEFSVSPVDSLLSKTREEDTLSRRLSTSAQASIPTVIVSRSSD